MGEVVLAEVDAGLAVVRAVRTAVRDEIRAALLAGGQSVGDEIIEVRWGEDAFGQPVLSERPSMIIVDDARVVVFGALPDNATSVEAVAPDGEHVACTIGEGVWLVVLPNNHRGGELYPVLFRDRLGEPVNPGLPASWRREAIGQREQRCPACRADTWDLFTAAWQGTGALRNTRWGHGVGPGQAFVCRVCGYERKLGQRIGHARSERTGL